MTQINLLHTDSEQKTHAVYRTLNVLGIIILIVALGSFVFFYLGAQSLNSSVSKIAQSRSAAQSGLENSKEYPALLSAQQKLKNLQSLLSQHTNWSDLITKFADATLKSTTFSDGTTTSTIYNKFSATSDGTVQISGIIGSFTDLDRLIKGLELQDFNSYITNVSLTNVGTAEKNSGITFTLAISFNKDILSAQAAAARQAGASSVDSSANNSANNSLNVSRGAQ